MSLLSIEKLTVRFGGLVALNAFDLEVPAGGLIGLIGPNGAGKTTVFNLVTGVYKPTSGSIVFKGNQLGKKPTHAIARLGIARTFQNIRLFPGLTARENLVAATAFARRGDAFASILGLPGAACRDRAALKRAEDMLDFVGMPDCGDSEGTGMSYGAQRKLEIARALMTDPCLLLLDEPAAGMNPTEKESLRKLVQTIAGKGIGILVIEHDMKFVMNLCSRITVLDHGEVICVGDPARVQSDKAVIEAYLGVEETDVA